MQSRPYLILAFLAALANQPAWADFDVAQLMDDLASNKGGHATFVEKKYIAVLDEPVVATGEMTYVAPDRLEKLTLTPKHELLVLDKDTLTLERDEKKRTVNLSGQPEILAFVDSIRSMLAGDRAALELNYQLSLSGTAGKWVLTLLPSKQRIAALLRRIVVGGSQNQIRDIEYVQADGDRIDLAINPVP